MLRDVGRYIRQHHLALIALFVALSGTAYAAARIGADDIKKNAVRSKHIKRENVKRSDVGANAVTGQKVAPDSLTGADLDYGVHFVHGENTLDGQFQAFADWPPPARSP